ncbi:MAG: glycosyltransferase [Bacteroides sp.]|nr:glycosyltransferase [Bacteroides sp.]
MKILHVAKGVGSGGVGQVVYDLAYTQKNEGNEVTVLTILKPTQKDNPQLFIEKGINIKVLRIHGSLDITIIPKLKKLFKQFDIVHVHLFPNQLYSAIAWRLLSIKSRPILITTEHNTWNNRRKYNVFKYIDRWFYKYYHSIVSISPETEYQLNNWLHSDLLSKKIITIYNGIDINKYQNPIVTSNLRRELNIKSDTKIIVMVARMTHPKDPITLVKAIPNIPNVEIIFVGNGELTNDIKQTAKDLNIEDRIHILGLRKDVPNILAISDIGCLSTKWDGFGLVAVEYMAAGLPVLVTDVPGLREVVGDSDSLFPYQDYLQLEKKIKEIITNDEKYHEKKIYSLLRCKNFSVKKMTDGYKKLYESLYTSYH